MVITTERSNVIDIQQVNKHYALINPTKYQVQPVGHEMGIITNYAKKKGHAVPVTIQRLFDAFSNGQTVILSNFEIDKNDSMRFVSSSVFAIDIDDDYSKTKPVQVLNQLKEVCTGLFYTFSHGTKGNRYRLVFQLDRSITNEKDYSMIVKYVMDKLKASGLPVDESAKNPTTPIRTGVKGHIINDFNAKIKVSEVLPKAKARYEAELKVIEEKRQQALQDSMKNPVTFEDLKAMCEAVGHIPSGHGYETTQKWLQVVYAIKHQANIGIISDDEGYELFSIVSGGESTEKYWLSIKPSGFVTVGTIIHHAQQNGYKFTNRYRHAMKETTERIETERIRSRKYLTEEIATELLERNERLLVESATGSGKTTAFMNAFKKLSNDSNDFYIFAAPTIVLSEQVAKDHSVTCIRGGSKGAKYKVYQAINRSERIFVSTYDKALELCGMITESNHDARFYVVIDEVHKFTEAYNYRFTTIDRLQSLSNVATSLIGLSGTPEDILKDDFDKLIKIDTGNEKSPCTDYRVFTYDRVSDAKMIDSGNRLLIPVVQALLKQSRVLLFINNKERIQTIARLLRKEGIKTATVTSSEKQSATYRNVVENSTVDDDIQVVLTTVVLADGITIKNELDWSCLVVTDKESPIFNTSTIKQISNRFRNKYRYFALYMRTPNEVYEKENKRFFIGSDYRYRFNVASNYVEFLNDEYKENDYIDFVPSHVEKNHGIYHKSTEEDAVIEFNPLFLRHESMKQKEKYYEIHRQAFIKEVERLVGHEVTGVFNVNEEAAKSGANLGGLLADIQDESEQKKVEADELRQQFEDYFTEEAYNALIHKDDTSTITNFKKNVHPDQYSATTRNVKIASYETCKTLGGAIRRKKDINVFINDIQALVDIAVFENSKRTTITKRVFNELRTIEGTLYESADFKHVTENVIKRRVRVTKKDVKGGLKMFHVESVRPSGVSCKSIVPLTIELVAKRHGISEDEVKKSILKYIATKPKQQQRVMLSAVEKKYGITPSNM